jgi:multiple sugar transport system substrate-binding protein
MSKKFLLLLVIGLLTVFSVAAQDQPFAGRTLTFVTVQPHAVASNYLADRFEEETGATVEVLEEPYDAIAQTALLDVTSGAALYDVIEVWYPSLGFLAENGILVDLTDWWEANAEAMDFADFVPSILDPYTLYDGRRWTVPYDGDTHILYYNRALFEEYGVEPPTTWAEYQEVCQTITEAGSADGVYGCAIMGANVPLILIGTFANRLGGFGGAFFDEEGNPTINSPEAVAALQALLDAAPYALPTPSATAFDEAIAGFTAGRVGMMEFWTDLGQISDNPEASAIVGQWGAAPMLTDTADRETATALNAGFALGISSASDDPELAQAFLEFVVRPDINLEVNTIVGGLDPTRLSTFDHEDYRAHVSPELADTARSALQNATAWPNTPEWAELQEVLNRNLGEALAGNLTAQEALDATQAEWETILAG